MFLLGIDTSQVSDLFHPKQFVHNEEPRSTSASYLFSFERREIETLTGAESKSYDRAYWNVLEQTVLFAKLKTCACAYNMRVLLEASYYTVRK